MIEPIAAEKNVLLAIENSTASKMTNTVLTQCHAYVLLIPCLLTCLLTYFLLLLLAMSCHTPHPEVQRKTLGDIWLSFVGEPGVVLMEFLHAAHGLAFPAHTPSLSQTSRASLFPWGGLW